MTWSRPLSLTARDAVVGSSSKSRWALLADGNPTLLPNWPSLSLRFSVPIYSVVAKRRVGNGLVKSGLQGESEMRRAASLDMLRNLVDPGTRDAGLGIRGCGIEQSIWVCGISHAHHRSNAGCWGPS